MDKILEAARATGAQAIHPGYGFLSENSTFARAVTDAGLAWIGPPPRAIEVMGDKIESRRAMVDAGVPCVPGLTDPVADPEAARVAAEEIGYPVAIKAAAGGGGKGIRVVRESSELESAFRTASGEAQAAFGDGRLYLDAHAPLAEDQARWGRKFAGLQNVLAANAIDRKVRVDWSRARQVAKDARGIPVPISAGSPDLDGVLASAARVPSEPYWAAADYADL